jgi:hypothetical protein
VPILEPLDKGVTVYYDVWFRKFDSDTAYLFVCDVASKRLAERIAKNLEDEGFVLEAWIEQL